MVNGSNEYIVGCLHRTFDCNQYVRLTCCNKENVFIMYEEWTLKFENDMKKGYPKCKN